MIKRSKKKMFILVGIFLVLTGAVMIFFNVPYSKTKAEFNKAAGKLTAITNQAKGTFKQEDIIGLPMPVHNMDPFFIEFPWRNI